jgi:hypothetical protein
VLISLVAIATIAQLQRIETTEVDCLADAPAA